MKEIKFRAWDDDIKQMLPIVDLSAPIEYHKWLGVKDIDIMQYTGLKDRNGKEVYEGDIMSGGLTVEFENGAFTVSTPQNRINRKNKEQEWLEKGEEFMAFNCKNSLSYLGANTHLEVIGNIYENTDLIIKIV